MIANVRYVKVTSNVYGILDSPLAHKMASGNEFNIPLTNEATNKYCVI